MGYCVSMSIDLKPIPVEKQEAALRAINHLHSDALLSSQASGGSWGGDSASRPLRERRWYSWVNNPPPEGFASLVEALREWRYEAMKMKDGSVLIKYFEGEKWGDDEVLYHALSPFLEGVIEVRGEDDTFWCYVFEDGHMAEKQGEVVYR